MSITLVTLAFKLALPSTQKFVLVALCDSANDQGECYPSVATLAEKCSLGERTVQESVTALEALGHVRREFRKGRSTIYWIDATPAPTAPQGCATRTPAAAAPPQQPHPAPAVGAPPPPQIAHPGGAVGAPITVNEPSVEPSVKQKKGAVTEGPSVAELVEAGMAEKTAEDFISHKASLKAPLTQRAWADHQREALKAGWTVHDAAEKVMAKHWKGFEAKYVLNEQRPPAASKHSGFAAKNYREGITEDGSLA